MKAVDDQHETLAFLSAPGTLDGSPSLERRDTHASVVFLTPHHAYKLKRAVRFDYLDYSTPELRRRACQAELSVNRRTAADLYLGVAAVTRQSDGALAIDGPGEPIDWLVVMRRFDDRQLLDALAGRGALPLSSMGPLAEAVHTLHATAARTPSQGGLAGMAWVVDGNDRDFEQLSSILDRRQSLDLTTRCRDALERHSALLERRRALGWVRRCHGDLHLGNVVLLDGRPRLFDAIEFSDAIACVDVWYDLAFLLMDLNRRSLAAHAHTVFQRYADLEAELDGLALLPFFLACRAAVRAKTTATAAGLQPRAAAVLTSTARQYLDLASSLLTPARPVLFALGGLSGSGKSTVAAALAPTIGAAPGAVTISSDVVRKQLAGVRRETRLPPSAYSAGANRRVYEALIARAATALAAGRAVVVDAVHARSEDRDAIARVAAQAGVPFVGVWLEAAPEEQAERIRSRTLDASDATVAVLEAQRAAPVGAVSWLRVDTSAPIADVVARVRGASALP